MLGTPNGGSHAIPAMLMGRDALVKKLALLDLRNAHSELLGTIAGFDGVLNLLPHAGTLDLYNPQVWAQLLELDAPESGACSAAASPPRSRRGFAGRCRQRPHSHGPGRSPAAFGKARSTRRASPTSPARRTRPRAIC